MVKWNFPSRNNGQIEGFSNPGLAWSAQASGISIPDEVAEVLEDEWKNAITCNILCEGALNGITGKNIWV